MGLSEEWFWNSEPKKVITMLNEKAKLDKEKAKLNAYYIASFVMGVDPDEEETGLAGIDRPASSDVLSSFNL